MGRKTKYSKIIDEKILQSHFEKVQANYPAFSKFRDDASDIAANNGLTDEILEELLS